ncbi:hypothetical protein [Leisingera sp. McT4-56]|uniref:hypothetical protein n=1 Tax=Leisingera sp. McT4-56 TaxID=2881255 RepID=UPI001CF85CE5|nr:hypothetical protein [Leisingera sp. McT4-56]MCB4457281.1 hypothetical protein [Leisingera sp. McT4-56]
MSRKPQRILAAGASLLALAAGAAQADQVFNDDVIATFSLCVGNDCVSGESFGFDTIRLKENNTRIKFQDTSNSASFPTNDWQLTANSSDNGGGNYFSIDDVDGSSTPFLVEAGAGNNAVYVKSTGYVGFGTSSPVVDLHVKQGNSPALRLEQDGSSGFSSQAWDIAGNETNFFIRDVTNSSLLPFKIQPGAGTNLLYLANNEEVGINTSSPAGVLHVLETDNISGATEHVLFQNNNGTQAHRTLLTMRNNGGSQIIFDNTATSGDWRIAHRNNDQAFGIFTSYNNTTPLLLTQDGNLTITGSITTAGSCSVGCDRVFDADYEVMSIEERAQFMFANRYLPNVGPTPEEGSYNMTEKMFGILNELEHAHIYISQLNQRIAALEADN